MYHYEIVIDEEPYSADGSGEDIADYLDQMDLVPPGDLPEELVLDMMAYDLDSTKDEHDPHSLRSAWFQRSCPYKDGRKPTFYSLATRPWQDFVAKSLVDAWRGAIEPNTHNSVIANRADNLHWNTGVAFFFDLVEREVRDESSILEDIVAIAGGRLEEI